MIDSIAAKSWRSSFGAAMPAGFLMRAAIPERWLRIHSLPEAKRYPESKAECDELLARHNAVASSTLGEGSECLLFVARYKDEQQWSADDIPQLACLGPTHALSGSLDGDPIQFFAAQASWRAGAFDDLIVASAEDSTGPLLFVNLSMGSAYSPYDGGADLFFATAAACAAAKSKFSSWLSTREDGL